MFKNTAVAFLVVVVFGCVYGAVVPGMLARLDAATARQCKAHDWPVKAHQIHMDWCADNGYATH